MSDSDWFAPKRLGYGAGVPIAWQGWALVLGFAAVMIAAGLWLVPGHIPLFIAVAVIGSLALSVIAARHTRGGWKWRWRGED